jgi:hypothetical protein
VVGGVYIGIVAIGLILILIGLWKNDERLKLKMDTEILFAEF